MCYLTVQQSGSMSLATGSKAITGDCCLGSHNLTEPSLPPLTISQGPYPFPIDPAPSTLLTILSWACTCQKTFYFSRSKIESFPSRSPKQKQVCVDGLAPKVPVLIPLLFSIVDTTLSYPFVNWWISINPVAFGLSPQTTNLLVSGTHFTS